MEECAEKRDAVPPKDQILQQIERIASSSGFIGSEPLRNVLLYLAAQGIEHPGRTVKEYEIATQALGRDANFDSRFDSTVRSIVSRLRGKIAEYYIDEGSKDPVLIAIPKGSYALSFSFRQQESSTTHPAPEAIHPQIDIGMKPSRSRMSLIVVIALLSVGVLVFAIWHIRGSASAEDDGEKIFWSQFLKRDDPLMIFPNPSFVGLPETGLRLADPGTSNPAGEIDLLTGTGEAVSLSMLTQEIVEMGRHVRVKRAHLFTWDDALSTNLIILGGQVQNAAMAQLPQLQRFILKSPANEPFLHRGAVKDNAPAPGGEEYYLASEDFNNGNDFAIIALTDGVSPNHQILVLAGTNTYGTEGATELMCNSTLLSELLRRLGVHQGEPIPLFEAVLRIPIRGGAPLAPELVQVYKRH